MKPYLRASLALLMFVALLTPAAHSQESQPADKSSSLAESLISKSHQIQSLRKSKTVSELKALLANDFQYVDDDGKLHHASELLDDVQEGSLRDFKLYNPGVLELNSETALVTYNVILSKREGDDPGMAPRYQKISDLWVREGGDWRLKFEQATPLRPID